MTFPVTSIGTGEGHGREELLSHLKRNISVDWTERQAARAKLRVLVKRMLRRFGYPPDLQDVAVQTVIQQAELYAAEWARAAA